MNTIFIKEKNNSIHNLVASTSLFAILCSGSAYAQTAKDKKDDEEAVIVVTGSGLKVAPGSPAYNVQQIDRAQLLQSSSGRLEDALSGASGFQQFRRSDSRSSNPSAQGVTLRALGGTATSRTLVLLDGVPMADPFFGYIPLSAIAPERLAGARVTRGGGAGAFGSGAVAGTIELSSANAHQLGMFAGNAAINNRAETEFSATLAPKLGDGFAVIGGRWDRGKGFWTTPESQRVPASVRASFDSWSVGLRAVALLAPDIELQARGLAFEDNRTLRFQGADTGSSGQDASLRIVGGGAWQFDVLGYIQARDFNNIVISSTSFRKTLDQRNTPSTGAGGKIEVRPPVGGGHLMRIGADMRVADGDGYETAYNAGTGAVTAQRRAGGRNSDFAVFIEDDWNLGPLLLTAGGRADRWSIKDGSLTSTNAAATVVTKTVYPDRSGWTGSFRGGAVLKAIKGIELRGAIYTGLRQPTLNELYRSFTVFPVVTRANAALKNERLFGFEAGADITPLPGVMFSVTAYDNKIKDAIANVTIGVNLRERQNVDAVRARGLEFGSSVKAGQFSFDGSLVLADAKVEASGAAVGLDGKRPAQTPKVAVSGSVSWHPADGWTLSGTVRHVSAQFEDDLENDSLKAATTISAFAQIPLSDSFSIILRGENLTNTEVITRNQAGSIDLGTPRTLWAGVRVRLR